MAKRWYYGLEEKVGDSTSDYKSYSEEIVAGALESDCIRFAYEDPLDLKDDYGKKKTWHPDFHLKDLGIILEYVGRYEGEGEKEYKERIESKKKIYEENNTPVVFIYPEEIWEESSNGYRVRKDAEEKVLQKVYEKQMRMRSGRDVTRTSRLDEKLKSGYGFQKYSAV